jgi:hypothetical protein
LKQPDTVPIIKKEIRMTIFPEHIHVRVVEAATSKSIPNIVLGINLFANHKDNYGFPLPITNDKGAIEVSREWLSHKVDQIRSVFLMDYSSPLDDCQPKFELIFFDGEGIKRLVSAQKLYQKALNIPDFQIESYLHTDNWKYSEMSKIIEFTQEKIVDVSLLANKIAGL